MKAFAMAVLMFKEMCDIMIDVSHLRWRNRLFDENEEFVWFFFERRKNSQFRQGSAVMLSAIPNGIVCLARLLRELQKFVWS